MKQQSTTKRTKKKEDFKFKYKSKDGAIFENNRRVRLTVKNMNLPVFFTKDRLVYLPVYGRFKKDKLVDLYCKKPTISDIASYFSYMRHENVVSDHPLNLSDPKTGNAFGWMNVFKKNRQLIDEHKFLKYMVFLGMGLSNSIYPLYILDKDILITTPREFELKCKDMENIDTSTLFETNINSSVLHKMPSVYIHKTFRNVKDIEIRAFVVYTLLKKFRNTIGDEMVETKINQDTYPIWAGEMHQNYENPLLYFSIDILTKDAREFVGHLNQKFPRLSIDLKSTREERQWLHNHNKLVSIKGLGDTCPLFCDQVKQLKNQVKSILEDDRELEKEKNEEGDILCQEQNDVIQALLSTQIGILTGPGGTGKSRVIGRLPPPILINLPTCRVQDSIRIREKDNGGVTVHTNAFWDYRARKEFQGGIPEESFKTIVFDEATMLNPGECQRLIEYFHNTYPLARLVFVGDTLQMCHMRAGCVLKNLIECFPQCHQKLTTIHRQKDQNTALYRVLSILRDPQRREELHNLQFDNTMSMQMYSPGIIDTIISKYKKKENVQFICSTSSDVRQFNYIAMKHLFKLAPPAIDRRRYNHPVFNAKNTPPGWFDYNWARCFFVQQLVIVGSGCKGISGKILIVKSIEKDGVRVDRTYGDNVRYNRFKNDYHIYLADCTNPKKIFKYSWQFLINHMSPAYAITINKMQGCENDQMFYLPSGQMSYLNTNILSTLYTAISRARKKCTVIIPSQYKSKRNFIKYVLEHNRERSGIMNNV
jgi:hypothetical protein